jgi:hypothetical protein
MITVSCHMAPMCFNFSLVDVGTASPSALSRSAAIAIERSCCEAAGIWQWVGGEAPHVREAELLCCRDVEL